MLENVQNHIPVKFVAIFWIPKVTIIRTFEIISWIFRLWGSDWWDRILWCITSNFFQPKIIQYNIISWNSEKKVWHFHAYTRPTKLKYYIFSSCKMDTCINILLSFFLMPLNKYVQEYFFNSLISKVYFSPWLYFISTTDVEKIEVNFKVTNLDELPLKNNIFFFKLNKFSQTNIFFKWLINYF